MRSTTWWHRTLTRESFTPIVFVATLATGPSACSSSSAAPADAGVEASLAGDGSGSVMGCSPTGPSCGTGSTCCLNSATPAAGGSYSLSGTCGITPCPSGFGYSCTSNAACASGDVCCATLTVPAGSNIAQFLPPAFDLPQAAATGMFDASGFGLSIVCQNGCDGPSLGVDSTGIQLCRSDVECPSGDVCYALPSPVGASIGGTMGCIPAAWLSDGGVDAAVDSP